MKLNAKKVLMSLFVVGFTFVTLTGNVFAADCPNDSTGCNGVCVPNSLINIVATIVNIIKIGVPIILVVLGMIDMGKAVASQKDEEIKKGQKTLMSRCVAAGIVFFVVAIVQLLFNIIGQDDVNHTMWTCIDRFFTGV